MQEERISMLWRIIAPFTMSNSLIPYKHFTSNKRLDSSAMSNIAPFIKSNHYSLEKGTRNKRFQGHTGYMVSFIKSNSSLETVHHEQETLCYREYMAPFINSNSYFFETQNISDLWGIIAPFIKSNSYSLESPHQEQEIRVLQGINNTIYKVQL